MPGYVTIIVQAEIEPGVMVSDTRIQVSNPVTLLKVTWSFPSKANRPAR